MHIFYLNVINFSRIIIYISIQPLNIYSAPSSSSSASSNNTGGRSKNNNRGRFLQLASSSMRRSHQQKTKNNTPSSATTAVSSKTAGGRAGTSSNNNRGNFHRLSPLKEHANNQYSHPHQKQQQEQKSIAIGTYTNNNIDLAGGTTPTPTMFSQAELYDIEESFKLFDIHGEGIVQVGDVRSILLVLQQEQQQQHQQQSMTSYNYPHLNTLLYQLSELSEEDNLTLDEYVQLMANTTNNNEKEDDEENNHFIRVFRLFDTDEKGYITVNDLQRVAIELGEHDMTIDEIQEMIDRAKTKNSNDNDNDDGKVYIDDFIQMMTMSLFPRGNTRTVEDGEEEGEL